MTVLSARFSQSPTEVKRYMLDWTAQLSTGEKVTALVAVVIPMSLHTDGTNPTAMTVTGIVITPDGTQAIFYAQGGEDGYQYEIDFTATTSIAQKFEDVVEIDIASKI